MITMVVLFCINICGNATRIESIVLAYASMYNLLSESSSILLNITLLFLLSILNTIYLGYVD